MKMDGKGKQHTKKKEKKWTSTYAKNKHQNTLKIDEHDADEENRKTVGSWWTIELIIDWRIIYKKLKNTENNTTPFNFNANKKSQSTIQSRGKIIS